MIRENRKTDHIKYSLQLGDGPLSPGFEDVRFLHNCLPELSLANVDLSTSLANIKLEIPLLINAITGGSNKVADENRLLASVAAETGCAMAVGSQYGAVTRKSIDESYSIIRKTNPNGIIFANIGANAKPEEAQFAVDMIEANGLQIHLNAAQELVMPEGDKDFSGYLRNIEQICNCIKVPVIVKETGCGVAREQVKQLLNCGVSIIDVGGAGGTNFPAIEVARRQTSDFNELFDWGIPTALSVLEARSVCDIGASIIATGGIRNANDMAKALALGADTVGMAGNILNKILVNGETAAIEGINDMLSMLRNIMVLTGCKRVSDLRSAPILFSGTLFQSLVCRGYDLVQLSIKR